MKYLPDFEALNDLVSQGMLSKKETEDLVLFNYTDAATYNKCWNPHTINSRGTIYEKSTGNVIAKAMPKFWNYSELDPNTQLSITENKNFTVYEKVDGSMGTIYFYNGKWNVATRGSFSSDQAVYAQTVLLPKYDTMMLCPAYTYICEIIYPENRIIVDYGDKEELVLLAVYNTITQQDIPIETIDSPFRKAQTFKVEDISDIATLLLDMKGVESEGFVVRLEDGTRVKFKAPDYLNIARIVTRTSPLTLWESMNNGLVSEELMQSIPEEFIGQYEAIRETLENQYTELEDKCRKRFIEAIKGSKVNGLATGNEAKDEKKKIALWLKDNPSELNPIVFQIWDDKSLDSFIMKSIRPNGNNLKDFNETN